jgi:hypothetical protein
MPPEAHAQDAAPEPDPTPPVRVEIDAQTYSRVQDLRVRICLTNQDLAALGCSGEQATEMLQTLVQWCEQNAVAMERAQAAELHARRELQEAVRRVSVGPRDETLLSSGLPAAQQSLASAEAGVREVEQGAVAAVSALLDSGQSATWETARANAAFPFRWRYAGRLTGEQARALEVAAYKRRLNAGEDQVLGSQQKLAMQQARAKQNQFMDQVCAAEASVLPAPAEHTSAMTDGDQAP